MLGLFNKDPLKKLKKRYARLLEQAMQAQRAGNIARYAELTKEADDLMNELDRQALVRASNSQSRWDR